MDINQFFWILGGLILGAVMFAITYKLTYMSGFSLFVGILFCLTGIPFACFKKKELTLYQYLYYKRRFKKKVKKLPNIRKEVNF